MEIWQDTVRALPDIYKSCIPNIRRFRYSYMGVEVEAKCSVKLTCVVRLKLFILLCEWNISSLHTERNRKISATKYSVNNFPTFTPNLSISHFAPLSQSYKGMSSTASEDAPCGGCQALVCGGDEALECDICGLWYHIACSWSSE